MADHGTHSSVAVMGPAVAGTLHMARDRLTSINAAKLLAIIHSAFEEDLGNIRILLVSAHASFLHGKCDYLCCLGNGLHMPAN